MEPVVEVTMTPCSLGSGARYYGLAEGETAHDKCPKKLGRFRCICECHGGPRKKPTAPEPVKKKRVVRRKARV